jgi:imidazole glycerol-phosphate synthase subunit HisH
MLTIVDYGVGNLASIQNMLKKAGATAVISSEKNDVQAATKIILPGMGHFDNCMQKFNDSGLRDIVEKKVFDEATPVLGICVGLQMLMHGSEEGVLPGLGWIDGATIRFREQEMQGVSKIPNMGWLEIKPEKVSRLPDAAGGERFYFAHSFHVQVNDTTDILYKASYGYDFTAAIERKNILGVQFHPEKSHRFGMQLLKNFAENY